MAVAYVGGVAASQSGATTVLTRTTTGGNLLVVGVQRPASTVSSITDTAGNSWSAIIASTGVSGLNNTDAAVEIWYAKNALSVTSVTVTMSGTDSGNAVLLEISGADTSQPLAYIAYGGSTTAGTAFPAGVTWGTDLANGTTANISTLPAHSLITELAVGIGGYTETTAGTRLDTIVSTWTAGPNTNNGTHTIATEYKAIAASTSQAFTSGSCGWTLSTAKANGAVFVVFKSALTQAQPTLSGGLEGDVLSAPPSGTSASGSWSPDGTSYNATHPTNWNPGTWQTSAQPESPVRAVKTPTQGQLWPRGTQGNGKYS